LSDRANTSIKSLKLACKPSIWRIASNPHD
jgi:hypothetical protein